MEIRSIRASVRVEPDKVRGSRFVGEAAPAADEDAARSFVAAVRSREPDASHHCWAFRLAGGRALSDDDGEPGGTGGPPILRHIEGADLHDVVVVVTRWFGGTKLGTGGLIRAYGGTAGEALAAAEVKVRPVVEALRIVHGYDLTARVSAVLASHDLEPAEAEYGGEVRLRVEVPVADVVALQADLVEATSGQVHARPVDTGPSPTGNR